MNADQRKQIEMLYHELFDMLIIYAEKALGNVSLAEEAVQETFRIACQHPEKVCKSPNPQGWIVTTLRLTIQNMIKSRKNAKKILDQYLLSGASEITYSEDRINIGILYENVVDTEEFKLICDMAIEGLSHKEMASKRGISVSACKKRVQRAKEILQKKIKKDVTK